MNASRWVTLTVVVGWAAYFMGVVVGTHDVKSSTRVVNVVGSREVRMNHLTGETVPGLTYFGTCSIVADLKAIYCATTDEGPPR